MKSNIVLIGMPGVGKSTIGVILAKILGYQFIDSDLIIQKRCDKLLKEIIEEKGVDGFIEIENGVNCSLNEKNTIIATGGSAVYGKEAMKHFSENAIIIYLEIGLIPLTRRLGDLQNRGVVLHEGQNLKDIYNERVPLYNKYADIIVNEDDCSIEKTITKIERKLQAYRDKNGIK